MDESLWHSIARMSQTQPVPFTLGIAIIIDILSGWVAAGIERELNSKVGFGGMLKKVFILLIVSMCYAVDRVNPEVPIFKLACIGFTCNECLSILENAKRCGVPIPAGIADVVSTLGRSKSVTKDGIHLDVAGVKDAEVHVAMTEDGSTKQLKVTTEDSRRIVPPDRPRGG